MPVVSCKKRSYRAFETIELLKFVRTQWDLSKIYLKSCWETFSEKASEKFCSENCRLSSSDIRLSIWRVCPPEEKARFPEMQIVQRPGRCNFRHPKRWKCGDLLISNEHLLVRQMNSRSTSTGNFPVESALDCKQTRLSFERLVEANLWLLSHFSLKLINFVSR